VRESEKEKERTLQEEENRKERCRNAT